MPTLATFICECGTRLNVMTDPKGNGRTNIPCPKKSCKIEHIVKGQILQVFIVDVNGKSVPYDWKTPK